MLPLLLALTGCTYDEEFSCEPWQGWWSGQLTGDLEATLVGEFYAFYEGAFTPTGGANLVLSLRNVDIAPLLGQDGPVPPGEAYGLSAPEGGECEEAWKGSLDVSVSLVVLQDSDDTGDTGQPVDTGEPGDTGGPAVGPLLWSGSLEGSLEDPDHHDPASGGGSWSLEGTDGSSLVGDWTLSFDSDFPETAS